MTGGPQNETTTLAPEKGMSRELVVVITVCSIVVVLGVGVVVIYIVSVQHKVIR